jgi:hypothetical protein
LTVVEKDQTNKYSVNGNLFYTDKKTGENWYIDKSMDESTFETMRDAFSLCRQLNTDNKVTKVYESNRLFVNHRTHTLPDNISLRVDSNLRKDSSFLQVKMKMKLSNADFDTEMDALDSIETPDLVAEKYKKLNNDAYITQKELEDQLQSSKGGNNKSYDMVLD